MKLSDTIVVITGGAKGLGKAMAKIFIEKGARVVICDKNKTELDQTTQELKLIGYAADVTNESELSAVAKKVVDACGRIDIWINNAGIWMPRLLLENVDLEKAQKLFQTNIFGTIHGMRAALLQMKLQGSGTIMNIISTTAFDGMNGSSGSMYVASKYALRGLTNAVRDELKETAIQIIGVYPGGIKTDIFNEAKPATIDEFMSPESVAQKIIENLEKTKPEIELILKRPGQK